MLCSSIAQSFSRTSAVVMSFRFAMSCSLFLTIALVYTDEMLGWKSLIEFYASCASEFEFAKLMRPNEFFFL